MGVQWVYIVRCKFMGMEYKKYDLVPQLFRVRKAMLQAKTTTPKDKRLPVRTAEPEKTILEQAAKAKNMDVSQFVRQASLEMARLVLQMPPRIASTAIEDQSEFHLPPDQWEAFYQRLDEPPKAIPALQQLFSEQELF
jgi:uncharacterized protein (DUF1778 family)